MNWGRSIALVMVIFIGFILTLCIILMSKNVELVSEDYYVKEMEYEKEIQELNRGFALTKYLQIEKEKSFLHIKIRDSEKAYAATIELIRPNKKSEDRCFSFEPSNHYLIPLNVLNSGSYHLRIRLIVSGKPCLIRKQIYL